LRAMAVYEYLCMSCEHQFEERRSITETAVDTALRCPSCGGERVRRRFSMFATGGKGAAAPSAGGCCGGGGCVCGH
jgi:putative FmdB family regulatory protein